MHHQGQGPAALSVRREGELRSHRFLRANRWSPILPGNSYDSDTFVEQLEQTAIFTDTSVKTALVDLGYRSREVDGVRILHRGKPKRMSKAEKRLFKRRQVEPSIGHLKVGHCMRRNLLKGGLSDAVTPILVAAGFNIRWLML